ncbi:MAG: hypothetical protein EON96_07180 [Caulobacteraceae bacterium]|nr:MAG: hypothetical protein EON96_07180 [Caulobacteraceae bacterium]
MRRLPLVLAACAGLTACGPSLPKSVNADGLKVDIGRVMGDDFTCVILVDKASGREVFKSGLNQSCRNAYPACTSPGEITAYDLAKSAAKGAAVATGCQSVSWAAGAAGKGPYAYAAVMYGKRALPGMEMTRRLDAVFSNNGL